MKKFKIPELYKEYESIINQTIRKSNEISLVAEKTKPWASKLGGCPYLEDINTYPFDEDGKPYMFLAQINLSDLIELNDFPSKGLLQFYIHNDNCIGHHGVCEVKYIENYLTDEKKLISQNPYEDSYKKLLPFKREGSMHFELQEMPVHCTSKAFENLFSEIISYEEELDDEELDEKWEFFGKSGCRIGGYPFFIQNESACYEEYNMLLLQLDYEDECGIAFGDAGSCHFFIKEDLKNMNFSNVVYEWQCG